MLVKWMGYSDLTWEPRENIPDQIVEFYSISTNLRQNLPKPYIKHIKEAGKGHLSTTYSPGKGGKAKKSGLIKTCLMYYCKTTEDDLLSCNTVKDRDKRLLRHTCGLLISVYPCGIIPHIGKKFLVWNNITIKIRITLVIFSKIYYIKYYR